MKVIKYACRRKNCNIANTCMRFYVLTTASMKMKALCDMAPCSLVEVDRRFRGAYCLHYHPHYHGCNWFIMRQNVLTRAQTLRIYKVMEFVSFQVLTAASMKFRIVFWDVLPCKIIVDRRFRGTCCSLIPDEGGSTYL
jgi:hypothetical protein